MSGGDSHLTTEKSVEEKCSGMGMITILANVCGGYKHQEEHTESFPNTVLLIAKLKRFFTYLHNVGEDRSRRLLYFGSHNN